MDDFYFKAFHAKVVEPVCSDQPLREKDDALAPLLKSILNAVIDGKMDSHLTVASRTEGNLRNGLLPFVV